MWRRYRGSAQRQSSFDDLTERVVRRGTLINMVGPLLLVVAAYVARQAGLGLDESQRPAIYPTLLYLFVAVGVADLAAAFFLRRSLFARSRFAGANLTPQATEAMVLRSATIIFAVGASPIVYGVVLFLLGGAIREVVYFALLNLLALRLLRPDAAYLEGVLGDPASDGYDPPS
ncbi:MAG TPA: hypothetical protein VM118_04160 [Acidobacteriota bacterium]|nr:hypothetical protein [Acidobacteriota bacterium]